MHELTFKERILELAKAYNIACGVGCKAIDTAGNLEAAYLCPNDSIFCRLVANDARAAELCRNSNLYGGYQAERLGYYYIYFCPFGLGNWAVPVYAEGTIQYYLLGGPVLLHNVDYLLLDDIYGRNPSLGLPRNQLEQILGQIPVVDPIRVRYLAQVLLSLAHTLMPEERIALEERHQLHTLSTQIIGHRSEQELSAFELESKLVAGIKTGDQQGAAEILNQIFGLIYFDDSSFELKKNRLIALMTILARAAIEAGADLEIVFGIEYQYLLKMEQTTDLMKLSSSLARVLDRFIECVFRLKHVKNRDLMFKAMNYIRHNYGESVSLEDVAKEVGLHPTYFSRLFKEEMNMTYTEYLNRVRVEASKILIRDGQPLVHVAQLVGFNDQSYFSKIFKQVEGTSPGRWRSKQT